MPAASGSRPALPVRFDEDAFDEDLQHATPAGRRVAIEARARLERHGIALQELRRCQAEGADGTRLGGCVKTYLPQPAGNWDAVFDLRYDEVERPYLLLLAFGVRHPTAPHRPSVDQIADRRRNPPTA